MRPPRKVALFAAASVALTAALAGAGTASAAAPAHPFPAHVTYQTGVLPSASASERDAAVKKQYDSWKTKFLRKACGGTFVVAAEDTHNNGMVSEGQGYGMNIVPLMAGYDPDAKAIFDDMWKFVQAHTDGKGLLQWIIDGKTCKYDDDGTPDSATDGDLDVGYGLLLADKQWGGYTAAAKDWLGKIYQHDVAPDGHLRIADDTGDDDTRPSDFMLDHLRAFAKFDTAHDWNKVITRTEQVITQFTANYSPNANLLSDFVVGAGGSSPKPADPNKHEGPYDNIVSYNSVRVPWHMGTDALLYGGKVATDVAKKEAASYKSKSGGNPSKIYPTVKLDGTPTNTGDQSETAPNSVGPAAMVSGDQAFTDALWKFMATNPYDDAYYGETIKMLCYLVMSGNYWAP
ncbi:glycosyl hydrolase family 8 [Amycolatopsis benzoatilytica]|uniref:glycosyl hydrolase family 8 n=1 Tax=Amycolatopsis benzoatilytica TaxID=346045 RepID=UPI0003639F9F|nr:glycosyl hydrolase family 8 [Amycolatopsis benzoatilytica]